MAKALKIVELGNPYIRAVSKPVSNIADKKFQKFIDDLIKTCDVNDGVGVAAPQVAKGKRVFIVWARPNKRYKKAPEMKPLVVINPKIISLSSKMNKDWEGCLSIPGLRGKINRPDSLIADFFGRDGKKLRQKFSGFVAISFSFIACRHSKRTSPEFLATITTVTLLISLLCIISLTKHKPQKPK